jgi:rod shape-determining protein MreD
VRRLLISVVLCALALAAQLTIVNRLALPGGTGPDLILLVVVALALTGGPVPGMLTGFLAGLALDAAPPAGHTIGQYALVFTLVGYLCGRLASLGEESPALYVAISAGAAAVGAVLYAVLGVMLSDPQVTWAAVQHVLPPLVVYNVLLSPFVLFGVVRLNSWVGGTSGQKGPSAALSSAAASAIGAAGLPTGAVRQAGASGSPRLHLGERRGGDAWIAAARASSPTRSSALGGTPQREPRLHFGGRRSPFASRSASAVSRMGAQPKFRKRSMRASIGTGGSLGRATPRRGTFGRRRSFRQRGALGGSRALGRSSAPRLKMGRGTWLGRLFRRNSAGRKWGGSR